MTGPGFKRTHRGPVVVGGGFGVNVAVQVNSDAGMANDAEHGDGDQPAKVEPWAAVACTDTVCPAANVPPPVAVPLPVPAIATVRGYVATGGAFAVNVAVHVSGADGIMKDAAQGEGDQPENVESGAGVAVSDTAASAA
jgi:hypothetical protein